MRRRFFRALVSLAALAATGSALAQGGYPERPIRLIVAFAAGSVTDIMGRAYGEQLRDQLGQPIVVDNRPGATGAIGADLVAKAPADGYTLLLNSSAMVINPWVKKQPFDFRKDLVPVARAANSVYLLTVNPSLPIRNLSEFIDYAKKNPGKLLCATYGIASPPHLALELLKKEAGIDVVHVPYKTFAQALPDLISGQLSCSLDPPTIPLQQVAAGKIRAVAQTGNAPMEGHPEVDAIGQRFPAATVVGWQAVFAPAATPAPVLAKLRTEWQKALASPAVQKTIRDAGFEASKGSLDDFTKEIGADYEKFGRVIRDNNIQLD
ncbi:tripartite tricarboxylate transporter substrate binding protein [Variovorax sp. Sphag1AA]|uniref:Bug family tripartite tricarboxylate transporter substrate binding protein n=1 Tax=Variovorax sp. Sphag1AA TaxID=2587027 RepID=UPI00161970C8|nr:tripartite tricarboxylate transporter substrate binding protein [Variovorax sp. Sphag1AA]MBB3178726.1 tripartite-type tricarboxylate transporter receptor subunit TctC [Variovorax sp. Sphag1AA]